MKKLLALLLALTMVLGKQDFYIKQMVVTF